MGLHHLFNNSSIQRLDQVSWGLQNIVQNIAILHGWEIDLDFYVYEKNWKQNGYDCGPITCEVLEYIWIHGFHLSQQGHWLKPPLPCCHSIRRRMAADIHALAWSSFQAWDTLETLPRPLNLSPVDLEACILLLHNFRENNPVNPGATLQPLLNKMDMSARSCSSCKQSKDHHPIPSPPSPSGPSFSIPSPPFQPHRHQKSGINPKPVVPVASDYFFHSPENPPPSPPLQPPTQALKGNPQNHHKFFSLVRSILSI